MGSLREVTLDEFLARLGSDAPAPGGGAVAALAGAQAASLVAMVARITMARRPDAAVDLGPTVERAESLSREMATLVDRDTEAFLEVMSAYRLPKDDAGRSGAIQAALRRAAEVPLETGRRSAEVMDLARMVAERGIPSARTDAAVALLMARAALEGAALNVLVNLAALKDRGFMGGTMREVAELREKGRETAAQLDAVFAGLVDKLPEV
ncbi:MAG: cyclodeaminase/cyclohydrolase family protein [Bacillota bacterium]|nr:cyclodeaminase/cyclohydrolase family protein [Bacillota bacterium]